MQAADANVEPVHKVTSVVRADSRTGHLVRTVVVSPKPVLPKPAGDSTVSKEPSETSNVEQIVEETALAYGLDPALVHSIIKVESNYNQYAISNKGAEGLMQLIPSTAKRMGVKNSFDAKQNVEAGVRYYKYLQSVFHDDRLALAAYNAGEGAVAKYNFQIPPYPETVNYVNQVGKHWGEASRRRKAPTPAPATVDASIAPLEPEHPKVEQYQDEQGRVYLRTVRQ